MSDWSNYLLRVYDRSDRLLYSTANIIDAQGSQVWLEIGRGGQVRLPYTGLEQLSIFQPGRRVFVTVANNVAVTVHSVCDFVIENVQLEETALETGGVGTVLYIEGRDLIKELADYSVRLRSISKTFSSIYNPLEIGPTTLRMNNGDSSRFANGSLAGWTVQLLDSGDWSEIESHSGNLLTINPVWQSNLANGATPALQLWMVYGSQVTPVNPADGSYTDLELIVTQAAQGGWQVDPQGWQSTAQGTFSAPNGANVLKMLQVTAAQAGEFFVRTTGERRVRWIRTIPAVSHPQYGGQLTLVVPDIVTPNNWQYGVVLPGTRYRQDGYETVTRVKPTGAGSGDAALSLKDLPSGFAPAAGYALDGEYLRYIAGEASGVQVAKDLRFEQIGPANDSDVSRQAAAIALYKAALNWLKERQSVRKSLSLECISPIPISPVAKLRVILPAYQIDQEMYVLEATARLKDGQLTYQLELSDKRAPFMDDERIVAEAIRSTDIGIFYNNAPNRNSRTLDLAQMIIDYPPVGGGVTDHGALTGLADDDHPHYLLANGGRLLTGNLSVSAGMTIDGVDISAHAGNPSAHHAPVTAGNAAISIAGQAVNIALAGPSGLEIATGGLRLADSIAGDGLAIANKTLSVALGAPDSGLVLASDRLSLGTPITVSATSVNAVSGTGHVHDVESSANGKTAVNTVLQSDAAGDLTLRFLTADKLVSPLIQTATGDIMIDPASAKVLADGNLSFVGARLIDTSTGSLTLAPAQTLILDPSDNVAQLAAAVTLKTAHWASGFLGTGWGMTYAGALDCRSIYADELHVASFTADTVRVKVGAEMITPSMALAARAFTVPAVNASAPLYVEDVPGWDNLPAFASGDWVLNHLIDRSGGGLTVANAWGQVTNYVDAADGQQQWTFTTRQAPLAVGKPFGPGATVLDFGKSGDGWISLTTLDTSGSPHLSIWTWQGANPYDDGNRQLRLRAGQLQGVSGAYEWGLQAGTATAAFVRFSNLRNEIHGSRLSLYAGDGSRVQVSAVDVLFYRTASAFDTLTPNADHNNIGAITSGATFYGMIDEGTASPNHNDYVANDANTAGQVTMGLTNPTAFTNINQVVVKVAYKAVGFGASNPDTVTLYAQVFEADELTPLTGEAMIVSRTTNLANATVTVTFPQHNATATAAAWANARLRLRWDYAINSVKEAIRLDPVVPALAVGNPLPTNYESGGDGLWVGLDGGQYKLRLGAPSGVGLRWTGTALELRNAANVPAIVAGNTGDLQIAGVLTIGQNGGVWQGAGTFAGPITGLKLYNTGGVGRLSTYNAGQEQITINTTGQLVAGNGRVTLDRTGLNIAPPSETFQAENAVTWRSPAGAALGVVAVGAASNARYMQIGVDPSFGGSIGNQQVDGLRIFRTDAGGGLATFNMPLSVAGYLYAEDIDDAGEIWLRGRDVVVNHGMTALAHSGATHGQLKPFATNEGGLAVQGFATQKIGLKLDGFATVEDTTTDTTSAAPIVLFGAKRNDTGSTVMNSNENLLALRNNGVTRMIVKGNGDIYSDSSGTVRTYDTYDDPALLRALSRELNPVGTIQDEFDRFVHYRRSDLEAAGILSGTMINQTALARLLIGAIWQLARRLTILEGES